MSSNILWTLQEHGKAERAKGRLKKRQAFYLAMHLLLPYYFPTSKKSWARSISALQTATIKKLQGANLSELQNQKSSR